MSDFATQPSRISLTASAVKAEARRCGFDLVGIAPAIPLPDWDSFDAWVNSGMAGAMSYLTDHRRERRADPRSLLPSASSIVCVGMLYNTPHPESASLAPSDCAWISRYAWGEDYHRLLLDHLRSFEARLRAISSDEFEALLCVDTAPILERSYARLAGLGWIGKNTCLIHEPTGSWYFLGEMLLSLSLEPDTPAPDRCGSCTRCIEACPTAAIVAADAVSDDRGSHRRQYFVDSRACISYYTIEKKGEIPEAARAGNGTHVFGCDICQDVCPWNRKAPVTADPQFEPLLPPAPPLERLASITESEFRGLFAGSPISRTRYRGFLRNVVVAMGNSRVPRFIPLLERLASHPDAIIAEHAGWALGQLRDASRQTDEEPATPLAETIGGTLSSKKL